MLTVCGYVWPPKTRNTARCAGTWKYLIGARKLSRGMNSLAFACPVFSFKIGILTGQLVRKRAIILLGMDRHFSANRALLWRLGAAEARFWVQPCRVACLACLRRSRSPAATAAMAACSKPSAACNSSCSTIGACRCSTPSERLDLLEILDDPHGRASTIVTSQVPVDQWHAIIGDPTLGMPSSTAYDATPRPQPQDESGSLIKLMARRMQISAGLGHGQFRTSLPRPTQGPARRLPRWLRAKWQYWPQHLRRKCDRGPR